MTRGLTLVSIACSLVAAGAPLFGWALSTLMFQDATAVQQVGVWAWFGLGVVGVLAEAIALPTAVGALVAARRQEASALGPGAALVLALVVPLTWLLPWGMIGGVLVWIGTQGVKF